MRLVVALLVAVASGGCIDSGESFEFAGSFREAATQGEMDDFRVRMERWGADDVLLLESFPVQFIVRGLEEDCASARAEAADLVYVRSVSECRPTPVAGPDDEATSNTAST